MPEKNETFTLNRNFTSSDIKTLRRGHIPQEMENKWFWYVLDNKLLYIGVGQDFVCIS